MASSSRCNTSTKHRRTHPDSKDDTKVLKEQTITEHYASHPKKVKVMSKSGQTDAERKLLRQDLRELNADIVSGVAGDGPGSLFENMREKNNQLWDRVRYTSEAALESNNLELIAAHAAREADDLILLPRYDAHCLIQKLREKVTFRVPSGIKRFDWRGFSTQVGICFNACSKHVSFQYGPLEVGYELPGQKRAARKKKVVQDDDIEEEEERLIETDHTIGRTGNELSAVEKHMRTTYRTLVKRSKEQMEGAKLREGDYISVLKKELLDLDVKERETIIAHKTKYYRAESQKVDVVQALFNPQSFTQTVENISHLSHLIKENRAAIEIRSIDEALELGYGPGPVVRPLMKEAEEIPRPRQAILSLNMKVRRHQLMLCFH